MSKLVYFPIKPVLEKGIFCRRKSFSSISFDDKCNKWKRSVCKRLKRGTDCGEELQREPPRERQPLNQQRVREATRRLKTMSLPLLSIALHHQQHSHQCCREETRPNSSPPDPTLVVHGKASMPAYSAEVGSVALAPLAPRSLRLLS